MSDDLRTRIADVIDREVDGLWEPLGVADALIRELGLRQESTCVWPDPLRAIGRKRPMGNFSSELTALLNRHSKENGSGTPDRILADYLLGCLSHFNVAVNRREAWYGREQDQRFGTPVEGIDADE